MLRNGKISDLSFIHRLILNGSKKGNFSPEFYLNQAANDGLRENLQSILDNQKRLDADLKTSTLITEHNGKPVAFVIFSKTQGNAIEIWMMGTDPQYQGKGIASSLLDKILNNYKNSNGVVLAKCHPASEIMLRLLIRKGFEILKTGESGISLLVYNFSSPSKKLRFWSRVFKFRIRALC
ncbi:GNAT family N-acetyltransferase [Acinetobacter sp. 187]|uniref:GNAT family N-acetyltransferase n=1 Tax=Acinetobacter lanii TaxID=2715163 RepID=UPI00140988D0|nr:GNAT family N-acetyltransferase [Acinetobacter lanii]NHC05028.1 GNAT family N-acetyltransferase [Acinetobacter lanii]